MTRRASYHAHMIGGNKLLRVATLTLAPCALLYDQLAKIEPLERALRELHADAWINGASAIRHAKRPAQ